MNVDKEAAERFNMDRTDCQRTMRSETDVCRLTRAVLEGKVSELSVRRQSKWVGEVVATGQLLEQVDAVAPAAIEPIVCHPSQRTKHWWRRANGKFLEHSEGRPGYNGMWTTYLIRCYWTRDKALLPGRPNILGPVRWAERRRMAARRWSSLSGKWGF